MVSSGINKEENSLIIDHKKEVHIYFLQFSRKDIGDTSATTQAVH
jgi:hypothetical protein